MHCRITDLVSITSKWHEEEKNKEKGTVVDKEEIKEA